MELEQSVILLHISELNAVFGLISFALSVKYLKRCHPQVLLPNFKFANSLLAQCQLLSCASGHVFMI